MRILLTSNASYDPPRGGSTRSNLKWLAHLAGRGHACLVVAPTADGAEDHESSLNGIAVRGVKNLSFRAAVLSESIAGWRPDWVLVSSEDVGHVLLREAERAAPGRLVYLAHTPQFYPFGPESWHPDEGGAEAVRGAAAVVVIGTHMAGYVERHLGRQARVIHPPMYGEPPYPRFGRYGGGWVLMVNPCAVKGLGIFLALADRFPAIEFAALNGWGTTEVDRAALAARPNTKLLQNVSNIDEVLREARLLLMPSVWYEGFGLIAMEAMLRGLPVIASDSGGLAEAKEGTGYVVPVRPVERYERAFDEMLMPRAVVPEQDLAPWAAALNELLTDEAAYRAEAERSRAAALRFVGRLNVADLETMLLGLTPGAAPVPVRTEHRSLDAAKRALLLARLRHRRASS